MTEEVWRDYTMYPGQEEITVYPESFYKKLDTYEIPSYHVCASDSLLVLEKQGRRCCAMVCEARFGVKTENDLLLALTHEEKAMMCRILDDWKVFYCKLDNGDLCGASKYLQVSHVRSHHQISFCLYKTY